MQMDVSTYVVDAACRVSSQIMIFTVLCYYHAFEGKVSSSLISHGSSIHSHLQKFQQNVEYNDAITVHASLILLDFLQSRSSITSQSPGIYKDTFLPLDWPLATQQHGVTNQISSNCWRRKTHTHRHSSYWWLTWLNIEVRIFLLQCGR
jgi:hypothetical protein